MEKVKDILLCVLLPMLVVMLFFDRCVPEQAEEQESYRDTIRTTFVDTIPYYKPVPKEEKPLGNITAKLPVSVPKLPESGKNLQDSVQNFGKSVPNDHFEDLSEMVTPDSADVVVPITQTVYEDSTYTAYVSGYKVRLDSIRTFTQRDVVTIKERIAEKPKRLHFGVQAGYGVGPHGAHPYIGIGVTYSLISW